MLAGFTEEQIEILRECLSAIVNEVEAGRREKIFEVLLSISFSGQHDWKDVDVVLTTWNRLVNDLGDNIE